MPSDIMGDDEIDDGLSPSRPISPNLDPNSEQDLKASESCMTAPMFDTNAHAPPVMQSTGRFELDDAALSNISIKIGQDMAQDFDTETMDLGKANSQMSTPSPTRRGPDAFEIEPEHVERDFGDLLDQTMDTHSLSLLDEQLPEFPQSLQVDMQLSAMDNKTDMDEAAAGSSKVLEKKRYPLHFYSSIQTTITQNCEQTD